MGSAASGEAGQGAEAAAEAAPGDGPAGAGEGVDGVSGDGVNGAARRGTKRSASGVERAAAGHTDDAEGERGGAAEAERAPAGDAGEVAGTAAGASAGGDGDDNEEERLRDEDADAPGDGNEEERLQDKDADARGGGPGDDAPDFEAMGVRALKAFLAARTVPLPAGALERADLARLCAAAQAAADPPDDDHACGICYALLARPHTAACCGKALCRACAFKALRRSPACPFCRAERASPASPDELAVDAATEEKLREVYGEAYAIREAQAAKDEEAIAEEIARQCTLPLFCLGDIDFEEGVAMVLHLFEPRYRWMAGRAIGEANVRGRAAMAAVSEADRTGGDGTGLFGLLTRGGFAEGALGRVVEIQRHRFNDDDTVDVLIVGRGEFVVRDIKAQAVAGAPRAPPLLVGVVEFVR